MRGPCWPAVLPTTLPYGFPSSVVKGAQAEARRRLPACLPSAARTRGPAPLCCAEELQALLDKVRYRKGVDLLVSVGDLVNKGPDSEKVGRQAERGVAVTYGN